MNNSSSGSEQQDDDRVVSFRRPGARDHRPSHAGETPPVDDLTRYERTEETPEEYRHRMIVNLMALGFIVLLIGGGIWLADTMASIRKNQDCVLSGRRGCTPVDYTPQPR